MNIAENIIFEIPPVTRSICLIVITLSLLSYLDITNPFSYYFSINIIKEHL